MRIIIFYFIMFISFTLFILLIYAVYRLQWNFIAKSQRYIVEKENLKHKYSFLTTFSVPIDSIISMRTSSEKIPKEENSPDLFARLGDAPYLAITYSLKSKKYITKYAYTSDPIRLREKIRKSLKS